MIAALTLLVVLTLSIVAVRAGAVALRLTGVPEDVARFQARSAFTGAGFTTSESEAIVNHPVRRRIVSTLMVVGSIGLVSVVTTMVVSLVAADGSEGSVLRQLLWLTGVLLVLWGVALNPRADRVMCGAIGRLLARTRGFGARDPVRLLQMPGGYGVTRVLVHRDSGLAGRPVGGLAAGRLTVLGLEHEDGAFSSRPDAAQALRVGDEIFLYGPDRELDALAGDSAGGRS